MTTNTFASNFSGDAVSAYIAAKILMLAEKQLVLYQLCEKDNLQYGNGRTFQYTRYERVSLPQTALSEGVTPGDTSMSIATVDAVMDQWGAVIPISDVAIDSVRHPVLQQAIRLNALAASETIDREIFKVLITGTNIFFPNAITARSSLTSSDKMSTAVIGKVVSNMRSDGAIPYDGAFYVGVVDPFCEDDVTNDSTFVQVAVYGNQKRLFNNEIGSWKGVRWMRSNSFPYIQLATAPTAAASSATAGSLANSTAYDFKLSVVDAKTGFETFMSATFSVTTGAAQSSVDITPAALPTGATAGSTYNLYMGSSGGTLYLAATGLAASTLYNQGVLPTSGNVAQAAPPSGIPVHYNFIFGKEGVACVELNKVKAYITPAKPSDSDPLVQRRKVGWKTDFKAVITNDLFLARVETAATNS